MNPLRVSVCATLFLGLISGCTSFEIIDSQSPELAVLELDIGDTVKVVTTDGKNVRFTLEAIEDDVLMGDNARVPIGDIHTVSVERVASNNVDEAIEAVSMLVGFTLGLYMLEAAGL